MSDQNFDQGRTGVPLTLPDAIISKAARPLRLGPTAVWSLSGAAALTLFAHFWNGEGEVINVVFTTAVTLAIAAWIVLLSQRVLLATAVVCSLVALVRTVSYVKQQATELVLHAYDLVWFFTSWTGPSLLWRDYPVHAAGLVSALFATGMTAWYAYRIDGTRAPRLYSALALAVLVATAFGAAQAKGDRRHTEIYFESLYVSFFYSSWSETVEALWRGRLIEAAEAEPQSPRFAEPARCAGQSKPNIVLIHQESVTAPSYFPTLSYDRRLDAFFNSFDGKMHKLRVETYGGASWLSEFSLLTGLSTFPFGGMRQFVQPVMAGKVRDTLPQALARCGYRTVLFYPMLRHFLAAGKFFEAVGLREIFDAKAQGAKWASERDRFYYDNALSEMERHFKASRQPLFVFIQTMATHGSYDWTFMPEVDVPGGGPGTDPEMHEFLRRLGIARMDYQHLRSELARRFPGRPFLIVHYGDHHPTATRKLLGFGEEASIEEIMRGQNPTRLLTYYAVEAINYVPPPLPEVDVLDIPYLGTVILEAARLPLSDSYRERKRLIRLCAGRYHDCPARDEVRRFHRRLIDSGLLEAL
jgi:hypothetical protein